MNNKPKMVWMLVPLFVMAAGLASAQEQEVQPPVAQPAVTVTIEEAVMCTGVVDRVPQGVPQAAAPAAEAVTETPADAQPAAATTTAAEVVPEFAVGKVYCFTKVTCSAPTTIKHVWYFGDTAVHSLELAIGGSPWRTWSNKTVAPQMTGAWKVEIQDAAGTVLKTLNFSAK